MFPVGQIVGGIIITYLIGTLLNWAIFKRTSLSTRSAAVASAAAAIVIAIVAYGFGNADGGPWNPGNGPIAYGIGGLVSGAIRYWRADMGNVINEGEAA
jgi:hypothetical protein